MNHLVFSRRRALAAVAALAALSSAPRPTAAAAPRSRRFRNAFGSYRFRVGDIAAMVVSDGQLIFPTAWYASNASKDEIESLMRQNFLPLDLVRNQTSGLVLDTGKTLLLAETGISPRWRSLTGAPPGSLDGTGTLVDHMRAAGASFGDVDAIFVSHGHPDHLGALLDDRGRPRFPRAHVFYDRRDFEYHTRAPELISPEERTTNEVARRILGALKGRIELTRPGDEIAAGVRTVDLAGHTPGHCGLAIESAGEQLFHGADLVAHHVLSLTRPDWSFYATVDKSAEVAARNQWFAKAADERLRLFFCHVPFPNLGHIVRAGDGFRWIPETYNWV